MRTFKLSRGVAVATILSIGILGGAGISSALGGISSALGGTSKRRQQPAYSGPAVQPLKSSKNKGKVEWIHVEYNGTKVASYPTSLTSTKIGEGEYEVVDTKNVEGCGYVATPFYPALIFVEPRTGNPDGVYVETLSTAYEFEESPFYLAIIC